MQFTIQCGANIQFQFTANIQLFHMKAEILSLIKLRFPN